jgi:mRNA-degrading endonuclease HigB of HigAB toxin-antitoxin module
MNFLLEKLFNKRGIKDTTQLTKEERQDFDNWTAILSKEELTTEDIKEFCKSQVDIIEGKWSDLNIENSKKAELIPYHTVYSVLLKVIDSPRLAREQLEKQLNELLK